MAKVTKPIGRARHRLFIFGAIGLLFLAVASSTALSGCRSSSKASALPVYWDLPSFSFTDQLGRTVTKESLRGRAVVANFVFTNCTDFCPTYLTPRMRELQDRLLSEGLAGREVGLLSFSVDPEQDTLETLKAYAENFGADPEVWHFLTGSPEEMQRVITQGLKLGIQKTGQEFEHTHPDSSLHVHKSDVIHSNSFILVDRQGQVRAYYNAVYDWDLEKIMKDIALVLASSR